MSYVIRYDPKLNIIRLELQTSVTADIAKAMCLDVLKLARVHKCKSALLIFKESTVVDDTMGIYNFAKSLSALGFDPSIRVANVLPRQDADHRFFETVVKNLGYEFRYFTDVSEAKRWLCERGSSLGGGGGKPESMAL